MTKTLFLQWKTVILCRRLLLLLLQVVGLALLLVHQLRVVPIEIIMHRRLRK